MKTAKAQQPGYQTVHVVRGVHYIYQYISTYDKEKKQSFNKQVCIGKKGPDGCTVPSPSTTSEHTLTD